MRRRIASAALVLLAGSAGFVGCSGAIPAIAISSSSDGDAQAEATDATGATDATASDGNADDDDARARDGAPADDPLDGSDAGDAAPAIGCLLAPDAPLINGAVAPSVLPVAGGYSMIYGGFSFQAGIYFFTSSADGITWAAGTQNASLRGFYFTRVKYSASTYALFYTPDAAAPADNQIWLATSTDGAAWGPAAMVVDVGAAGAFDEAGVERPSVVYARGRYWLWYTGFAKPSGSAIGLATSDDGVTWTKQPGPVLDKGPAGQFDDRGVNRPGVVFDGTIFHLFYLGYTAADQVNRIGLATSTDGVNWTRSAEPVLVPPDVEDWHEYGFMDPDPVIENGEITLWFDALGPNGYASIGRARCAL